MKNKIFALLFIVGCCCIFSTSSLEARCHTRFNISVGSVCRPAPVCYETYVVRQRPCYAPVYVQPVAAPVYVQPVAAPVYVQPVAAPVVVYPAPVCYTYRPVTTFFQGFSFSWGR